MRSGQRSAITSIPQLDGMTVWLGWGQTLRASLKHIAGRRLENMTVVSLLGALTRASGVNPAEFAWRFADLVGAQSFLLTAPVCLDDEMTRDSLRRHPGIAEVFDHAATLDIALLSVGGRSRNFAGCADAGFWFQAASPRLGAGCDDRVGETTRGHYRRGGRSGDAGRITNIFNSRQIH
jgi:DNA-binding transcriptional regulator LsrR (DeoR family)